MTNGRQTATASALRIFWLTLPHILNVAVAYGYMVLGGYIFWIIEEDVQYFNCTKTIDDHRQDTSQKIEQFYRSNNKDPANQELSVYLSQFAENVRNATLKQVESPVVEWNLLNGFLYTFSLVTTIGYSNLWTVTSLGRVFFVFYGVIGIPLFSLAMADIGMYLEEFMLWVYTSLLHYISTRFGVFPTWRTKRMIVPAESMLALPIVLVIFTLYTALGGFLFPLWEKGWSWVEGFYVAFDTITTIGIGDIYPKNSDAFMATVIYISVGIAIGCVAIGALSDYIKVVHYSGVNPSNCGMQVIWFGGKHLRVSEFVKLVGREFGATEYEIKTLQHNLDKVVNETFAERRKSRASYISPNDLYTESATPLKLVNYGVQPNLYQQVDSLKDSPDDVKF